MQVLQKHPELIMLSPQLARLIQAGQQLPNAQTVVSLSGNELSSGAGQVVETLQVMLKKLLERYNSTSADEK